MFIPYMTLHLHIPPITYHVAPHTHSNISNISSIAMNQADKLFCSSPGCTKPLQSRNNLLRHQRCQHGWHGGPHAAEAARFEIINVPDPTPDPFAVRALPSPTNTSLPELSASRRDSASSSLSPPAGPATPDAGNSVSNTAIVDDDDDSSDERQPAPAPSIPQVAYFGSDPTSFDDPVDYELRKVEPWMTPDEIRKVCSVADYPKKDLADLGPGTPPDKDYSNAKPTNQVQASTFQTAIEPYLQPLHEGDLAWLRARGDKVSPYVIPRHGEHYKIQWAREDGLSEPNIGKDDDDAYSGNLEVLPAEAAEAENFNVGPGGLASRLLQAMRPEYRAAAMDASTDNMADISMGGDVNGNNDDLNDILDGGDMSMGVGMGMTNGNGFGGSMSGGVGFDDSMGMGATSFPPATQMPGSNTESWKKLNQPTMDKDQFEEGVRQQLIHAGFLEPNTQKPDYDGQFDNPVAARLRELHAQLAVKSKENYAKKLRLLDLSKDHMAKQEFDTVSIDLDSQLNSNFQKRTRTMGKKGKAKRPHASVGNAVNPAGQAKPALGDQTKILMDRRKRWTATVGQVFEDPKQFNVPRASDPDSSIFKDEDMAPYRAAAAAHFENDEPEADE